MFNAGITKVSRTKLRTSKSKGSNTNINDLDKNISKKSVKYFLNHNHKSERLFQGIGACIFFLYFRLLSIFSWKN